MRNTFIEFRQSRRGGFYILDNNMKPTNSCNILFETVATYLTTGRRRKIYNIKARSSPREKTSGVATNVYSRKMLEKPKKAQNHHLSKCMKRISVGSVILMIKTQ